MSAVDNLYAVTFAGFVVKVCGSKREAQDAARDMRRQHPAAVITVAVL